MAAVHLRDPSMTSRTGRYHFAWCGQFSPRGITHLWSAVTCRRCKRKGDPRRRTS